MRLEQTFGPEIKPFEVIEFESMLRYEDIHMFGQYGFEKTGEIIIARAPATLDVIGGSVLHFGGTALGCTLERSAVIGCQALADPQLRVYSFQMAAEGKSPGVALPLDAFYEAGGLKSYAQMRYILNADARHAWAAHCLGSIFALLREGYLNHLQNGVALVAKSNIPGNAGVGATAALRVATLMSLNSLLGLNLTVPEITRIAQLVAERLVGIPPDTVEVSTAFTGRQQRLLNIMPSPEYVPLPLHARIIGLHSKVKADTYAVAYKNMRTAVKMGVIMRRKASNSGKPLSELSATDLRQLPKRIKGEAFLEMHADAAAEVPEIEPQRFYPVRSRMEHIVYEQARVQQFLTHLTHANNDPPLCREHLQRAGMLMYASNWSHRFRAGLSTPEIDQIVRSVRKIGRRGGFYGAKISGIGKGGTVAILCYGDVANALVQVFAAYKLSWGLDAEAFLGSSPSAADFGHVAVRLVQE